MRRPTIEDLQRLIPEADAALDDQPIHKDGSLEHLVSWVSVLVSDMGRVARSPSPHWSILRLLALRAFYICALIAWEAGRRALPKQEPHPPGECPTCDARSVRMFVNDGKGGMRPLDGPADDPAAKSVDVVAYWQRLASRAHGHLRAVVAQGWPDGTTGPEVVRKARAFLAGEEQPRQEDLERMLDDAEMMRDSYRRKHLAAVDRIRDLSREAEDWRAKWVTEREAHNRTRAQLATEDEAHAHTRARLAEVERYVDENVEARRKAQIRFAQAQTELAVLERGARDALAAQNRAESEASALREELRSIREDHKDVQEILEGLVAWAKKGRA